MRGFKEGIRNIFVGFLVGIGFVLPGLSGAVMAVVFGIYERLIEDLSLIKTRIKEDFWFLLTVGVGLLLGTMVFAFVWDAIPKDYMAVALAIFVGMIVGQLPELYKIVQEDGKTRPSYIVWFIIGLIAMAVIFVLEMGHEPQDIVLDSTLYMFILTFVTGLILSISGIIPGISATTLLLAFGMMNLMTNPLTNLDPVMLVALGVGVIVGLLWFAKMMDGLIKKHHAPTYYLIFGLTVGSVFVIMQQMVGVDTWVDVALCIAAGALGLLISIAFTLYGKTKDAYEAVLDEAA